MSSSALHDLVAAVEAALDDPGLEDDAARTDRFRAAMAALLADPDPLPAWAYEPLDGGAVGNLVHVDEQSRFHILAVVFPEGTSSGVHFHGCWGLIGYLRGGDEETRYTPHVARVRGAGGPGVDGAGAVEMAVGSADERLELDVVSRHVWHQGDITALLPPADGWHRVRNPGPGVGVSVHVLCMTPGEHPHEYWRRDDGKVLPFPFVEVAPDRWVARVAPT
jgi:predicted metal-dependent enzyme (double-stranded beta helix superfamily)